MPKLSKGFQVLAGLLVAIVLTACSASVKLPDARQMSPAELQPNFTKAMQAIEAVQTNGQKGDMKAASDQFQELNQAITAILPAIVGKDQSTAAKLQSAANELGEELGKKAPRKNEIDEEHGVIVNLLKQAAPKVGVTL